MDREIINSYSKIKGLNVSRETLRDLIFEYEFNISWSIKLYA